MVLYVDVYSFRMPTFDSCSGGYCSCDRRVAS